MGKGTQSKACMLDDFVFVGKEGGPTTIDLNGGVGTATGKRDQNRPKGGERRSSKLSLENVIPGTIHTLRPRIQAISGALPMSANF